MAVLVDAYSVIIRNLALERLYPGGVAGYGHDCPNRTYLTDGEVSRVAFMAWSDVETFLRSLQRYGINADSGEIAVVRPGKVIFATDWLELGFYKASLIARLVGSMLTSLVAPPGWHPGISTLVLHTEHELKASYDLLDVKGGVETYRNRQTGEVMYVGRAVKFRKRWWQFWKS